MDSERFKKTDIGLIHEDWDIKTVKQLMDENILEKPIDGNHGNIHPKSSDFVSSGIPFIMASDLKGENVDIVNCNFISKKQADSLQKGFSIEGDVLLSHKATMGRTAIVKDISSEYIVLTPQVTYYRIKDSKKLNNYFLKYYFDFENFQRLFKSWADSGSTRLYLGIIEQQKLPILIPPIEEQIKISEIILSIDRKIEINHKMNQTLEEISQAIFKYWFVDFEFPNEEGKPYKSNGGEMVDSQLGEIPNGWEVQEIGTVIETTGGGTPSTKKEEYWDNGDLQWFSPRDITANRQMFISNSEKRINSLGLEKSSAKLFPHYSLMMTSRATVGELSINTKEACTNQGFITCIPNERLSTFYLYYWIKMNKEYIISLASGSTFREISKSTFRSLKVVIPDGNLLKSYDSLLEPIFNQIQNLQSQNKNLSQIRDSILPKLMSGKIRL